MLHVHMFVHYTIMYICMHIWLKYRTYETMDEQS